LLFLRENVIFANTFDKCSIVCKFEHEIVKNTPAKVKTTLVKLDTKDTRKIDFKVS
jgi:hypothetical protein